MAIFSSKSTVNSLLKVEDVMWVKQCHKPLMTGNGEFISPMKMVMTGGWFNLFLPTLPFRYWGLYSIRKGESLVVQTSHYDSDYSDNDRGILSTAQVFVGYAQAI